MAEVVDMLESHQRQQKLKQDMYMGRLRDFVAVLDKFQLNLISNFADAFNNGGDYKSLCDCFGELFAAKSSEAGAGSKKKELSPEMQVYKAQRMDHAYRLNKSRKNSG
ncbi:MAG: hypothetical protein ACI4R5_08625 [Acetatifactor sp.]